MATNCSTLNWPARYVFRLLVQHNQLDLLLLTQGSFLLRAQPALPVALVQFLHDHFPRNLELLVKTHLCFGLEGQLADLLLQKAHRLTGST